MVALPSSTTVDYTKMRPQRLAEIIETQRTIIQEQEARLRYYECYDRLFEIPNKKLSLGEKLAWAVAGPILAKETPDEHGFVRCPLDAIAPKIGMSRGQTGRYIAALCERFGATHETQRYLTKKNQERKLLYVDPSDALWTTPVDELEGKERVINGNQCPHCHAKGTYHINKRIVTSQEVAMCKDCGYIRVYPLQEQNAPLPPGEYPPEKGSQPENLLAVVVEADPSTNKAEDCHEVEDPEKGFQAETPLALAVEADPPTSEIEDRHEIEVPEKGFQAETLLAVVVEADPPPSMGEMEDCREVEDHQEDPEKGFQPENLLVVVDPPFSLPEVANIRDIENQEEHPVGNPEKGSQPEKPFGQRPQNMLHVRPITAPPIPHFTSWLEHRIGIDPRIGYATGKLTSGDKYLTITEDDKKRGRGLSMDAYLAGKRGDIYTSRPLQEDETTYLLCFDLDSAELDAQHRTWMTDLARGGISSMYWRRRRPGQTEQRGHLEIYFDAPVSAQGAYEWCLSVSPALAEVKECYPVRGRREDKRHCNLSWPLWLRTNGLVEACPVEVMTADLPGEIAEHVGITGDQAQLWTLIELATIAAGRVPTWTPPPAPEPTTHTRSAAAGGALLEQPISALSALEENRDVTGLALAEWNAAHSWDEVIALCGGATSSGHFKAIWRGERTGSVKVDRDGVLACDYGNHGMFPRKLDVFEAWCLAQRMEKKVELARLCQDYRMKHADSCPSKQGREKKEAPVVGTPAMLTPIPVTKADENECCMFGCSNQYKHIGAHGRRYCDRCWPGSPLPLSPAPDREVMDV